MPRFHGVVIKDHEPNLNALSKENALLRGRVEDLEDKVDHMLEVLICLVNRTDEVHDHCNLSCGSAMSELKL